MSMQAFYTNIAANTVAEQLQDLLRVTKASLEQVQAVRSELAWDTWGEAK